MTTPLVALDPELDSAFLGLVAELPGSRNDWIEPWTNWASAGEARRAQWISAAGDLGLGSPAPEDAAQLNSFGATWELIRQLQADRAVGRARIYLNPRGGNDSDLDDGAWAAWYLANVSATRVAYLDLGAEPLERTAELLGLGVRIPAAWPGASLELGSSRAEDPGLLRAVSSALAALPGDLEALVVRAGADGLWSDSRTSSEFTPEGMGGAGLLIGQFMAVSGGSVLVLGGRGGDDAHQGWLHMVSALAGSFLFAALDTVPVTG